MARQTHLAFAQARTLELRLDWLANVWDEFDQAMCFLAAEKLPGQVIVTCRRTPCGGRYAGRLGDETARLAIATAFLKRGWCDVAMETAEHFHGDIAKWINKGRVMVSHHDFRRTASLSRTVKRLRKCKGHAIKIAAQCNSIRDSLRVLELCKGRRDVIAVPVGEMGLPARVLALKHGSALAYAAVAEKTAPGQLTLDEMKNLYRADKLDKRTRVYGVIGNPVSHSLSPLLHNTGFIARRMNDVYLPFLVNDLPDFLSAIKPLGIRGFSVTIPFKEKILRHLDECDPLAAAIGAVNTVSVRGNGKLYGMNTDYVGVLRALQKRISLRGSRVLVYGAGGVARAVAFALAQEGAIAAICARRVEQARKLARAVPGETIERRHLRTEFFDAIVNCTPVGMSPQIGASPLQAKELNCRLVFDTIYRPVKTKLLQLAESRDIETVSGVEMFLAQGMAQWEIWTEQRAPEKPMRAAVIAKLKQEEKSG